MTPTHNEATRADTSPNSLDEGRAAEQHHQFEEPPELEAAFAALAPGRPARREAALGVAA